MRRRPGIEVQPNSFEDYVMQNSQGIPIELDSAPTTAGGQLPYHGDSGYYSGNLYLNLGGTVRRFAYTDV